MLPADSSLPSLSLTAGLVDVLPLVDRDVELLDLLDEQRVLHVLLSGLVPQVLQSLLLSVHTRLVVLRRIINRPASGYTKQYVIA